MTPAAARAVDGEWLVPPPLVRGSRISIIAPSGPFERERFDAGLTRIASMGFVPVYESGLFDSTHGYLAGHDARRAAELVSALADDSTRAIWTARGGYGATRILPGVDLAAIRAARKWLIGFSDATALHAAWSRARVQSVHGANVTTLSAWNDGAREGLSRLLTDPSAAWELRGQRWAGQGRAHGWLGGGNLTVLAAMAGTQQLPSFAGAVVFLEDVGERPYRLDRSLTQLLQAGAFEGAVGFAIGQLTDCYQSQRGEAPADAEAAILRALQPLGVPVVGHLPLGHEASSEATAFGVPATVDAEAGVLRVMPAPRGDA